MRQNLGKKKVKKLREELKLPIIHVLVRGGTNHRRDLCLADGTVWHLYKDGELIKSDIGWNPEG